MNNGNKPAMPLGDSRINYTEVNELCAGLTKREYFAAMAMQGQLAGLGAYFNEGYTNADDPDVIAKNSVDYADALLKALEANNENN